MHELTLRQRIAYPVAHPVAQSVALSVFVLSERLFQGLRRRVSQGIGEAVVAEFEVSENDGHVQAPVEDKAAKCKELRRQKQPLLLHCIFITVPFAVGYLGTKLGGAHEA